MLNFSSSSFFIKLFFLVFIFILCSCKEKDKTTPEWEWSDTDSTGTLTSDKSLYIWIDAAANFPDYADSKENIRTDLTKVKETGFTDIVVDVRPTTGDVLFQSSNAPQVTKLDVWQDSNYLFFERTATWDYLQAFIDIGHELGLKVHASINTFVGGTSYLYNLGDPQGILFRDDSKRDWATTLNLSSGLVNTLDLTDNSRTTRFLNPVNEDVQNYVLGLINELAQYNLDGIVLDRCRFDDLTSDFSDYTIEKFETYIGETITNVPDDIVEPGTEAGSLPEQLPVYFKKWLEFRVKVIHDFVETARNNVNAVNPDIKFEVYVGGWYSTYFDSGVNWASPKYDASADYSWATTDYKNYGFADLLDFLLLGAYTSADAVYGNDEWTVQGFCKQARNKLKGDVTFAGGPDVGNWTIPDGTDVTSAVTNTVNVCMKTSNGYFVFDISSVRDNNYWAALKKGIDSFYENQ